MNVSYGGQLAKLSFNISWEDDKKRIDLYADKEHFHTMMFPAETSHAEIIQNVKSNLFGV